MNYDAFSHGQISSKIWLCEILESYLTSDSTIYILGSWYNILGFMLLTRQVYCKEIIGIDKDESSIAIANKICDTWRFEFPAVNNIVADANSFSDYKENSVVINCSAEHFENNHWFDLVPTNSLVCIQSSDMVETGDPWFIKQPNPDIETFANRYPLQRIHLLDTLRIQYDSFGYDRFMLIGKK